MVKTSRPRTDILCGVKQDERAPFDRALQRARASAYAPDEFVEQESFMRAGEIRALAIAAGIGRGVSVLDLCCGVAGPGRFITRELGCSYLGVDLSPSAIGIARERARDLPCRFEVAQIPPIPPGPFDVVLLLETMLAFPDKQPLLDEIAGALATGGRFGFTLEEGLPLTEAERKRMPDADTVWLIPLEEMLDGLEQAGLAVRWQEDFSRSHRADRGFVDQRVRRRCRRDCRADRTSGTRRTAGRPPAVERLAARRTGPQARPRRGEGLTYGLTQHQRELRVGAIRRVPGGDDPAGAVEGEVLAELASPVEIGGDDPIAAEAGVQRAVRLVPNQCHIEDRRAGRAADEHDSPLRIGGHVLGEVIPTPRSVVTVPLCPNAESGVPSAR